MTLISNRNNRYGAVLPVCSHKENHKSNIIWCQQLSVEVLVDKLEHPVMQDCRYVRTHIQPSVYYKKKEQEKGSLLYKIASCILIFTSPLNLSFRPKNGCGVHMFYFLVINTQCVQQKTDILCRAHQICFCL